LNDNFIGAGIPAQLEPAATAVGVKPGFYLDAFGVGPHKGPVQVTLIRVGEAVRHKRDFSIDKFLDRAGPTVGAGDLDAHYISELKFRSGILP
jgi:hypothetical protein